LATSKNAAEFDLAKELRTIKKTYEKHVLTSTTAHDDRLLKDEMHTSWVACYRNHIDKLNNGMKDLKEESFRRIHNNKLLMKKGDLAVHKHEEGKASFKKKMAVQFIKSLL
jgi:hypothetical protein